MEVSVFPEELYEAPKSWAEKAFPKLIYYKKHNEGGHFAAWEQPDMLVSDIRAGFKTFVRQDIWLRRELATAYKLYAVIF